MGRKFTIKLARKNTSNNNQEIALKKVKNKDKNPQNPNQQHKKSADIF